ncbi:MAG: hypothetical protein ABIR33_09525 [Pyrinomonadaceae bacterium]
MPEPVPTPTASQIVTVAEIAMVTVALVITAIAADSDQDISDAKWAKTLTDIALWDGGVSTDAGDVKRVDVIEFFEGSNVNARLNIRNRIRARYGFDLLTTDLGSVLVQGYAAVTVEADW